jgi:hypothetical protein
MAVHGAALHKRVEKHLRQYLREYGVDDSLYTCKISGYWEFDPELNLYADFTHKSGNSCRITITDIFTEKETGHVLQHMPAELH